jgi:hypothetical protein
MITIRPRLMAGPLSSYWPPGDIRNFWPGLLHRVLRKLLPDQRPPYLKAMIEQLGVSEMDLFEAMRRYIRATRLLREDPDVKTLDVACAREGFVLSPLAAQAVIHMLVGEMTAGVYAAGLKDTTPMGENGIRDDVESLVWAAEQHVQQLRQG